MGRKTHLDFSQSIMTQEDRVEFQKAWRDLMAQQVYNGSFLEFSRYAFRRWWRQKYTTPSENNDNEGRDVFRHILAHATNTRLYLKCKFKLAKVNDDNTPIGQSGLTWSSLEEKSKGKKDCEPDLIVRTPDAIKIYELKMGKGKQESSTAPKEYHQLLRAYWLFKRYFMNSPEFANYTKPRIELYFVGWSAPNAASVVFGEPSWKNTFEVTVQKINGAGMAGTGCPVNARVITRLITLLNAQKAHTFWTCLNPYFNEWGVGRETTNAYLTNLMKNLRNERPKYNKALVAPPLGVITRAKAKAQNKAAEAKLRGLAVSAFNTATRAGNNGRKGLSALARRYTQRGNLAQNFSVRTYNTTPNNERRRAQFVMSSARPGTVRNVLRSTNALSNSNLQYLLNARKLKALGLNNSVVSAALSNAENFGNTYEKFVVQHGAPNTNAGRALLRALQTQIPGREQNFARKLNIKANTNAKGARAKVPRRV
jgi:hypothetical protein